MSEVKKMYALVGNFGFKPDPKGLSVFSYDPDTAQMELIETYFDEANVGHQSIDETRNIVYLVNEQPSLRGRKGGGGYVMAVKIDIDNGKASLINEQPSLSHEPCYTCLDKTKNFLLVSHHADFGFVTKIIRNENYYSTETYFDDTGLVLFNINPDGSLGEVSDVVLTPGDGAYGPHTWSRHHSVIENPSGELFIVCDKGLDQFHTYHLNRKKGTLENMKHIDVAFGLAPRYGVFHPELPYFYANYEKKPVIDAYKYEISTGDLERVGRVSLITSGDENDVIHSPKLIHPKTLHEIGLAQTEKAESADIVIHPSGKYIYASLRGLNKIALLDIDEDGGISLRNDIHCGGVNPRGLQISPDNQFLLSANMESGNITVFSITKDGSLLPTDVQVKARCPGNIRIITG